MAEPYLESAQGVSAREDESFTPDHVRRLYDDGLKAQRRTSQDYWLNHAFLQGHQWLFVDRTTRTLKELPRDEDRYRATINRLAAATRSIMSKYTQRELAFEVIPSEATDAANTGARLGESVLEGVRKSHSWETKRETAGLAAWKGGTSAICVDWDPNAGDPLFTNGMESAEDYGTEGEPETVSEGDSVETVLSAAEFIVQPGVKDGKLGRYWIKALAVPPSEVQATYKMAKPPPADATAGLTPFSAKLLASHISPDSSDERPELTLVLTYYERPNPRNKKGTVAVVVNNKFVDGPKPWPFPWTDRLNLAIHRETIDETKAFGSTVLSEARGPQVAINAAWSNILEHLKNAGNARLVVDAMNANLMEDFTDLPGETLLEQTGSNPTHWLSPADIGQQAYRIIEELRTELDDILGNHDVSRGSTPNNIESGYGLSILAEQDNSPTTRLVKDSAIMWSEVATMVLRLYQQETKHTRKTTIKKDSRGPKTVKWTGDSFCGQTDASIPLDGILPRSRAAQMAVAEKFVQMGLVTDLSIAAKIAELPGQEDLLAAVNPDLHRAQEENYMLAQGRPAVVAFFDNHETHIRAHTEEMKNMGWDQTDQAIKDMFIQHLQQHETIASEAAGAAQARAQVSPLAATAPNAQQIPTIAPGELPPGAAADDQLPQGEQAPPGVAGPTPVEGATSALDTMDPTQVAALEAAR